MYLGVVFCDTLTASVLRLGDNLLIKYLFIQICCVTYFLFFE